MKAVESSVKWSGAGGNGVMDDRGVEWGEWLGEIWYLKACLWRFLIQIYFGVMGRVWEGDWREREVSKATSGFDRGYRLLFRIPLFTYGHSVSFIWFIFIKKGTNWLFWFMMLF